MPIRALLTILPLMSARAIASNQAAAPTAKYCEGSRRRVGWLLAAGPSAAATLAARGAVLLSWQGETECSWTERLCAADLVGVGEHVDAGVVGVRGARGGVQPVHQRQLAGVEAQQLHSVRKLVHQDVLVPEVPGGWEVGLEEQQHAASLSCVPGCFGRLLELHSSPTNSKAADQPLTELRAAAHPPSITSSSPIAVVGTLVVPPTPLMAEKGRPSKLFTPASQANSGRSVRPCCRAMMPTLGLHLSRLTLTALGDRSSMRSTTQAARLTTLSATRSQACGGGAGAG